MLLTAPDAGSPHSLESWIGDVCAAFLREEPRWQARAPARLSMAASAHAIPGDGAVFGRSAMPPCSIFNGRTTEDRARGKYYLCQLSAPYRLNVDGAESTVHPGQILVMSAHVPHRMTFHQPFLAHSLVVEEDLLRPWFVGQERLSPHARWLPHGGGDIFRTVMQQTFKLPESRIAAQAERVAGSLIDILCAFGPDQDDTEAGRTGRSPTRKPPANSRKASRG